MLWSHNLISWRQIDRVIVAVYGFFYDLKNVAYSNIIFEAQRCVQLTNAAQNFCSAVMFLVSTIDSKFGLCLQNMQS